jgi:hypothetical protein
VPLLVGGTPGRGGSLLNGVTVLTSVPQSGPLTFAPSQTVQNAADPIIYIAPVSGGIQVSGSATVSKTKAFLPSAGIQFAGSAPRAKTKAYGPTAGGVQTGGSALLVKIKAFVAAGALALSGAAAFTKTKVYQGAGALWIAGFGTTAQAPEAQPSKSGLSLSMTNKMVLPGSQ